MIIAFRPGHCGGGGGGGYLVYFSDGDVPSFRISFSLIFLE